MIRRERTGAATGACSFARFLSFPFFGVSPLSSSPSTFVPSVPSNAPLADPDYVTLETLAAGGRHKLLAMHDFSRTRALGLAFIRPGKLALLSVTLDREGQAERIRNSQWITPRDLPGLRAIFDAAEKAFTADPGAGEEAPR